MSNEVKSLSLLSIDELTKAVDGFVIGRNNDLHDIVFTSVTTDSRNVKKNTLFVPLFGEFQDGHNYIPQAVDKGASVVFVAQKSFDDKKGFYDDFACKNQNVAFIVVKNTLHALQNAAEQYVAHFPSLIRCSVTGSSGKTTTKELCVAVLSQKFNVVCNKGNFNSETGLPLSVFDIRSEHELGFFEMGMNRENEIGEIAKVFKPQYGVITNIGTAHIGILGSRQKIAEEKRKIFSYIPDFGKAIIPAKDEFVSYLAEGIEDKVITYASGDMSDGIEFIRDDGLNGTVFSIDGVEIRLLLPGKYNYYDALGAVALGKVLDLTVEQIKKGIESVKPLSGRSRVISGKLDIMEDCYNANPDSMNAALEFCSDVDHKGKKFFVLGDMLELGEASRFEHEKVGKIVSEIKEAVVVFFGDEMKYAYDEAVKLSEKNADKIILHVSGHDDKSISLAADFINKYASSGDFVLLKGSRGMGLERLIPLING